MTTGSPARAGLPPSGRARCCAPSGWSSRSFGGLAATLTAGTDISRRLRFDRGWTATRRGANPQLSVRLPNVTAMGAPAGEQLSLPDLDGAAEMSLRETTFVVVDLETTGGRMTAGDGNGRRRHHRDRGGQSARRCGARRVRHPCRPATQHPAADRATDRHHHGDGVRCPDHRRGVADVFRVRPRCGAGGPQRPVRRRVLAGRRRPVRYRMAATAGAVHRSAGPPGAQPRGSSQRATGGAGAAVRGRQRAHPPGARRRAGHRRCVACADRAGGQSRGAHLRRLALVSARRDARHSDASGCWPRGCRTGPGFTCSADRRGGALRRHGN